MLLSSVDTTAAVVKTFPTFPEKRNFSTLHKKTIFHLSSCIWYDGWRKWVPPCFIYQNIIIICSLDVVGQSSAVCARKQSILHPLGYYLIVPAVPSGERRALRIYAIISWRQDRRHERAERKKGTMNSQRKHPSSSIAWKFRTEQTKNILDDLDIHVFIIYCRLVRPVHR